MELELNAGNAVTRLDEISEKLDRVGSRTATPRLDLDDSAFNRKIDAAQAKLAALASPGGFLGAAILGGAALTPAVGGVAAGLGASVGGLGLAYAGISGALKDYTAAQNAADTATKASGKSAISTASQIHSAQVAVSNAATAEAHDEITSAEAIRNAKQAVAQATQQAANSRISAEEGVARAEEQLQNAQYAERQAQIALTDARQQAILTLQQLHDAEADASLSAEQAQLDLEQARLNAANVDKSATATALQKAQADLSVREAEQRLKEALEAKKNSADAANKADREGVNGLPSVVNAAHAVKQAQQGVADAHRGVADAQRNLVTAERQGADAIAKAQQSLADAVRNASWQQQADAQRVSDAQYSLHAAYAAAAAGSTSAGSAATKYQQALAKLSPAGRELVKDFIALHDLLKPLEGAAEKALAPGVTALTKGIKSLAPTLATEVTQMDTILGGFATRLGHVMETSGFHDTLTKLFAEANQFLTIVTPAVGKMLGDIFTAGANSPQAVKGLADGIAAIAKGFGDLARNLAPAAPALGSALANIGKLLGGLTGAAGGVLADELKVLSGFLGFVAGLPKSVQSTLTELAAWFLVLKKTGVLSVGVKLIGGAATLLGKLFGAGGSAAGGAEVEVGAAGMQRAADTMVTAAAAMQRAADTMVGADVGRPGAPGKGSIPGGPATGETAGGGILSTLMAGISKGGLIVAGAAIAGGIVLKVREDIKSGFQGIIRDIPKWFNFGTLGFIAQSAQGWADLIVSKVRHSLMSWEDDVRHYIASSFDLIRHEAATEWDGIAGDLAGYWDKLRHNASAAFDGIRHFISSSWDQTRHDAATAWNGIITFLTGSWNKLTADAKASWGTLENTFSTGWKWITSNVFDPMKNFLTSTLPSWFSTAVSGVASVWNKLENVVKAPVSWIINKVYDQGLVPVIHAVGGLIGLDLKPIAFAEGGKVTQGTTEKADDVLARISRNETVVSAEHSRILAPAFAAIGVPGYKTGGVPNPIGFVQHEASSLWKQAIGGLKDLTGDALALAAHHILDPLLAAMPGAGTILGADLKKIPVKMVDAVINAIKGATAGVSGSVGSGSGADVAKYAASFGTGKGHPYVWGGSVPSGWDCSGFSAFVYEHFGYFPEKQGARHGTSESQFVDPLLQSSGAVPGALVFLQGSGGPPPGHVGVVLNGKSYVSAYDTAEGTVVKPLSGAMGYRIPKGGFQAGGTSGKDPASAKAYAKAHLSKYGWAASQFSPLDSLWTHESGWRYNAQNPNSPAYGIPQADPGSKMASAGADWRTNPATQMNWGLPYIKSTYGTPAHAWALWQQRSPHWYDAGGWMPPGLSLTMNGTGRPEPVFSPKQWDMLSSAIGPHGSVLPHKHTLKRLDRMIELLERAPAATAAGFGGQINGAARAAVTRGQFRTR